MVRETYCYGIMCGEPILGHLQKGLEAMFWTVKESNNILPRLIDRRTGKIRLRDPRLGPLPPGWGFKKKEKNEKDVKKKDVDEDEEALGIIVDLRSGEQLPSDQDPRTTPDELRRRGVKLRDFKLV